MNWKNLLPHIVAILVMIIVVFAYASPVLKGKVIEQSDILTHKHQAHETIEYREKFGEEPLWSTRVFSGMTTMHISTGFKANWVEKIKSWATDILPSPVNIMFFLCLGFYILLVSLGVNPWLALAASIGYGLSSNLLISLMAGHNTKVLSIAFAAPALAGLFHTFRGRYYIGGLLTIVFVAFLINANHFQIIYYFILMGLFLGVVEFIIALKRKELPKFWKAVALLLGFGVVASLPNFSRVYNVYEHGKLTMRGGESELSTKSEDDKGGLDIDYAMSWSYSPLETFTLIVPSATGGASTEALPENGEVAEKLNNYNLSKQQKERILNNAPTYVGEQPFTMGPIYFGAGFIFLFILSLFLFKNDVWAWAITITIFSIMIAWGRHFLVFTGLLFEHLPLYNKFRTPSMALAMAGIAIPFLGVLGINSVLQGKIQENQFRFALKWGSIVTGGIMLILLLYGITTDWIGDKDTQYQVENSPWAIDDIYKALLADRKAMFLKDWLTGLLFMAAIGGVTWLYWKRKTTALVLMVVLGAIFVIDSWRVSKRYLNNDNFVDGKKFETNFNPSPADQTILSDPDPHYRVLNVSRNPWTDSETGYYHENVGGYHPAKLQRYQDLIEHQLTPQLQLLQGALRQTGEGIFLDPIASKQLTAFNMLNTKYFIVQPNHPGGAALNPAAMGNAWFVEDVKKVSTADEEMAAISNTDLTSTAIVHEEFADDLWNKTFDKAGASITLNEFLPNYLNYTSNNSGMGLAVFSELYYPLGWQTYIDGEEVSTYRVNYLLRAVIVPPGQHTIEMKFEPKSFRIGNTVSLAGSILFVLACACLVFLSYRKRVSNTDGPEE